MSGRVEDDFSERVRRHTQSEEKKKETKNEGGKAEGERSHLMKTRLRNLIKIVSYVKWRIKFTTFDEPATWYFRYFYFMPVASSRVNKPYAIRIYTLRQTNLSSNQFQDLFSARRIFTIRSIGIVRRHRRKKGRRDEIRMH